VQDIQVINNCISGAGEAPSIDRAPDENVYTISGGCREKTVLKSKPVINPGAFFADALRTQLAKKGIEVRHIQRSSSLPYQGTEPPAEMLLAVHETTVAELLPRINKNSQNLLAEGLCKLLGAAYDRDRGEARPGSWSSGSEAVHAFLSRLNIDGSGVVVADGSGLSRRNRVTTRAISDLLIRMRPHEHGEVFYQSLSVGGVDGTIRSRYTDRSGEVHAKTGYIGGVRSLSGYTPSRKGTIVFSFIYNRIPGSVKPYEELQDYAVRTLMSWPELDYVPPPATQPTTQPATRPVAAGN
jgi:serine-type D-Ala-D-Ala carboxypeptidase/endopeptidase (penicillin-binding protein 4)